MCTDTFLRLPEEKRTRFLDAAWEEFGRVKFGDVSINQIIRRAGIPRGSFYQYFAGKEELFDYLVLDVQARFVETFRTLLEQKGGDLFQLPTAIFDLIVDQVGKPIPILDRCLRLFQVNPGIDLRRIIAGRLDQDPPPELLEKIDVSRLRGQDPAFVRRVVLIILSMLGGALMDSFLCPERSGEYRRELQAQLELIKYGSLQEQPRS